MHSIRAVTFGTLKRLEHFPRPFRYLRVINRGWANLLRMFGGDASGAAPEYQQTRKRVSAQPRLPPPRTSQARLIEPSQHPLEFRPSCNGRWGRLPLVLW